MNVLWDAKMVPRLIAALRKAHPAAARKALGDLCYRRLGRLGRVILPGIGFVFVCLWLTGSVANNQESAFRAAMGYTAAGWWLTAGLLRVGLPGTFWVPDILLLAPAGEKLVADDTWQKIRRALAVRFLAGMVPPALMAGFYFSRRDIAPSYGTLAIPAALLLWIHLMVVAAAIPFAAAFLTRVWKRLVLRGGKVWQYVISAAPVLVVLLILGLIAAPAALDAHSWQRRLGESLASVIPPAGFLLWPAHPDRIPYWQLAFTAALVWPALPEFRRWRCQWSHPPPVLMNMEGRWAAYEDPGGDEEWAGEQNNASAPYGTASSTAGNEPPVPMAVEEQLRITLRTRLMDDAWNADRFLIPAAPPPLTKRSLLPRPGILFSSLLGLTVAALSGSPYLQAFGWAWVLAHSLGWPSLPWCRLLSRHYHEMHGVAALHEWLPVPVQPAWEVGSKYVDRASICILAAGAVLYGAGTGITAITNAVPPLWPIGEQGHFPLWMGPVLLCIFLMCLVLTARAAAVIWFAHGLNPVFRLVFSSQLAFLPVLLVTGASILCTITAGAMTALSILSFQRIEPGAAAISLPLLLGGEILRRLSIRAVFHHWAHARKR